MRPKFGCEGSRWRGVTTGGGKEGEVTTAMRVSVRVRVRVRGLGLGLLSGYQL